jgi:FkbM family methyltransferase
MFRELCKNLVNIILKKINLRVIKLSTYLTLLEDRKKSFDIKFIKNIRSENISNVLKYINLSQSQIRQDLFVLSELNFKKKGFFVEFGSADGKFLSNTHLLEKEFDWTGILVEPAKIFHKELFKNRNCIIDKNCVYKNSDSEILFRESTIPELSSIGKYFNLDLNNRYSLKKYNVKTISLNDLLIKYSAPSIIDYLSIDTEGSEYDILSNFNFNKFKFKIITCEHNFNKNKDLINKLLISNGYVRKLMEISAQDYWYINPSIVK